MINKNDKLISYRVVVLVLLSIAFIGIYCVNYTATLTLIIGTFIGVYYLNIFVFFVKHRKILLISLLLMFLLTSSLRLLNIKTSFRTFSSNDPFFDEYKLIIRPENCQLSKYEIKEELKKKNNQIKITATRTKTVSSRTIGLLFKEVYIKPFNVNADNYINTVLSNGEQWKVQLCKDSCPESTIELVEFPQGSLYSIKNENDFYVVDKYLGKETLRWSVRDLNKGIRFAYLKPPFRILRKLIEPFIKLTESNKFFIAVLGAIFGLVLKPTIKPIKINNQAIPIEKKSTQPKKIIILAAIPHGLHLDKEIRSIEECIRGAVKRDIFKVEIRTAVQDQDIRRAIAEEKPVIVHFCGHGLEDGSLVLEDDRGNDKFISPSALAALFELHADYVECVVLNACYSLKAAEGICQYINYAIGMNQPIQDKSAIKFAQGFYDGLGYEIPENKNIYQRAFKEGLVAIKMDNLSQAEIPVLKTK